MANAPNPLQLLSQQQIRQQANQQASAALSPERVAILQAQKAAQRSAAQQAARIKGFSVAAAQLLAQQQPADTAAYQAAVNEQTGLAGGFSQQLRDSLAGVAGAHPQAVSDATYSLGGYVPGTRLTADQAAATTLGKSRVDTQLGYGQQGLQQAGAAAQEQNKSFLDALTALAAKRPALYQQALQNLQSSEQQKLALKASLDKAGFQSRADFARLYGYDPTTGQPTLTAKNDQARITLANKAQQRLVAKDQRAGKQIDVGASKLRGHVVYKDGSERPDIPVKQTSGTSGRTPYDNAYIYVSKNFRGPPITSEKVAALGTPGKPVGKYIAAKGVGIKNGKFVGGEGIYAGQYHRDKNGNVVQDVPRTTDNENQAARGPAKSSLTLQEQIAFLVHAYPGLTPRQARTAIMKAQQGK